MKARIVIFTSVMLMFFSCQEKKLEPINAFTGKPDPVSDAKATSTPGGAIISFVVPIDADVLAVKAVYTTTTGKQREAITSFYGGSLTLEGYNDTDEHEALLYTVSRAQELSDPVSVKFTPLESPLSKAAKSADITSDFGGAYFSWKNEDQVLLTVEMFAADDDGELKTARIVTSKLDSAYFSVRGYDTSPRVFAVVFSDNFDNVSEIIYPPDGVIIPWLESKIDKSLISVYKVNGNYLPYDINFNNFEGRDEYIFDDDVGTFGHCPSPSTLPANITFDIGKAARFSRVVFFQRYGASGGTYYNWGNPRHIIVYGRLEQPSPSGVLEEWEKLIDYTIEKPSGTNSDFSILTDEDRIAAENGHDASFPMSTSAYRYLRFSFVSSWEDRPYAHPAEITLYGEYAE